MDRFASWHVKLQIFADLNLPNVDQGYVQQCFQTFPSIQKCQREEAGSSFRIPRVRGKHCVLSSGSGRGLPRRGARVGGGYLCGILRGMLLPRDWRRRGTGMRFTVLLRAYSEKKGGEDARDRFLFFGGEDEDLTADALCFLHRVHFDFTRKARYLPRTLL